MLFKRLSILVTVLLLFSVVLAACGSSANNEPAANTAAETTVFTFTAFLAGGSHRRSGWCMSPTLQTGSMIRSG